LLGFLTGSLLSLLFPFLTQAIVDVGITTNNLSFIVLVLVAQLVLMISQTAVGFIRELDYASRERTGQYFADFRFSDQINETAGPVF
jgi:hypothetical protein